MNKVQHWKIYPVHFGGENDMLSIELIAMKTWVFPFWMPFIRDVKKLWMIGVYLTYMFILNLFNLILSNKNLLLLIGSNVDILKLHTWGVTVCK
jgi:hypothetical protein